MITLEELISRKKQLEKMISFSEKALANAPEGTLRGARNRKTWQYFWRKESTDRNGEYLKKSQMKLIKQLGQKKYCTLLRTSALAELKHINAMIAIYEKGNADESFTKLPESFQRITTPIVESDEVFIEKWENQAFDKNDYYNEMKVFTSNKKESMRSKSEVMIANMLAKNKIPYHYEKPLFLDGVGTVYPDFTLLDINKRQEIFWEHLGMMDDASYSGKATQKIQSYMKNAIYPGDRLILTFESRTNQIDISSIEKMILKRLRR